ncbi:MAG TPA: CoA-transferase, partial [Myxococcota bacterium]|nr:CoA-transferase [Myxococcota bacterium]
VAGAKKVLVAMEHTTKDGEPKIKKACELPLTGKQCVDMIITDLCVFKVYKGQGLVLTEYAPGISIEEIHQKTACHFSVAGDVKVIAV